MRTKRKNRNPHLTGVVMDLAHVVLCVGIVVCAVMIFLNPVYYQRLFPVVFALAALVQFLHGFPKLGGYRQSHGLDKGLLASGMVLCILGVVLAALSVVSAVTVW